jgi:hypothetical protein
MTEPGEERTADTSAHGGPTAGPTVGRTTPARTGRPSRTAVLAYRWAVTLFLVLGALQIFLAGLGAFSLLGSGPGFQPHRLNGFVMSGVALVVVVLALLARAGTRAVIVAAVLFLLAAFGQSLLAALGQDSAFFGGLHALAGLVILGLAGYLQSAAGRLAVR